MFRSIFRFTLNMHNHRSQTSVSAFRGDTGIRLLIKLTDGGNPYEIAKGCSAILSGTKADGNKLWNRCVIDHETNTIIYDFTEQTAAKEGIVNCEITLYGPDGAIITAPKFIIVVDEREVSTADSLVSANELNALEVIMHSEEARVNAEIIREANETARENAEEFRAQKEALIDNNERDRIEQEGWRVNHENTRITNEHKRATAENARVAAEKERASKDAVRDEKIAEIDAKIDTRLPQMQIIQEQLKPEAEENNGSIEFAERYDRAYIRRRDGKDSFIPFTLEAKRVDSIWERGESTPTIPLRHDYGQIEVAEPLYDDDAVPYSMVKELDSKVKEATSIAKGAQKAISFADYKTLINAVKKWGVGEYPIGQSIYIVTRDVPDLWISGEEELLSDWQDYTYNSDADFIADLRKNGKVYVGRYYISELETQKVDLTNHYDKSEIDSMIGDISSALDELHAYAQSLVNGGNA